MLTRRRLLPAALLSAVLLAGCASGPRGSSTRVEGVRAVDPSVGALSPAQKLDRALSLPGMKGVLQGTVGKTVFVRPLTGGARVTIDEFMIEQTFGFAPGATAAFATGQHVALAVPDGAGGQTTTAAATDAPSIHAGDHLLVFDQAGAGGQPLAELGSAVIVLADRSAVAPINPDGSISWEGFTEPAGSFTQHFISHPAHS